MPFPSLYRAKAVSVQSGIIQAFVPQVFGDTSISITESLGPMPDSTTMGWVFFQAGDADFPVWSSGLGTGSVSDTPGPPGPKGDPGPAGTPGSAGGAGPAGPNSVVIGPISGTYTVVDADQGKFFRNNGALTITLPTTPAISMECHFIRETANAVTFVAGSGATISSVAGRLQLASAYSVATVKKLTATQWLLFGDIV